MTRFLLSLEDSMDLVEFALHKGEQGNIFVKKAPATTIETLANALLEIFNAKNKIRIIGTRMGEKVHESLASGAELTTSEDLGDFYRIKTRGELDHDPYYRKGTKVLAEDYTSESTKQLGHKETVKLLSKLKFIKEALR